MNTDALRYIANVHYPASKLDVIAEAETNGAPQELIDALQRVSREKFGSAGEVRAGLKGAGV